ncbi:hypothetical protein HanRHA438_Chr09g0421831 [Helianthus annuus]|nr:hypothetical protein HanIR_Chr09g0441641 [Helianthus annuus]KAJ0890262.1 hypothetical protein HanRHA438_Chr09g0421831 [Helianthus annuus]
MKAWEDYKLIKGVQGFGFKVPQPKIHLKCLVLSFFSSSLVLECRKVLVKRFGEVWL